MTQTPEQKTANDEFRASHPIPADETAEQKGTRERAEKVEKDAANASTDPNKY